MVQLYKANNKNFTSNGDFNLDNIISSLNFTGGIKNIHNITIAIEFDEDGIWEQVKEYDVLKLDTPVLSDQLYRIYDVTPNDDNLIIEAQPIFMDAIKTVILDKRCVNLNGQQAMTKMMEGTLYTGHSNISTVSSCNWIKKNIVDSLIGTEDYSFVSNYGGELWINNFDITMDTKIGGDYGVQCSYGKDVKSIEKNVNIDSVFTRLIPCGDNNLMLVETYVDSPLINNYPIIQELPISMDDVKIGTEEGQFANEELARAEMKRRCLLMFSENNIDKPLVNFKVGIESLENTTEYNDFKSLVNVGIGDTVKVYYEPLNIDLNVRCLNINCSYNFATESWEYDEVELGDIIENYDTKVNNTSNNANNANNKVNKITDGDNIIAEKVKGYLDATKTSLKASKQIGELQDYRIALAEDLDPASPTYGSMLWGSGQIFLANKRTLDNKDWDYTTAITPNGIVAETLIGKLLANLDGTNYVDLDNGLIKGKDLSIDLTNGIIKFVRGLIQGNNLTINLDTGQVNFKKGIIEGKNSSWNLDTGIFKTRVDYPTFSTEVQIGNGVISSTSNFEIIGERGVELTTNTWKSSIAVGTNGVYGEGAWINGEEVLINASSKTGGHIQLQGNTNFSDGAFFQKSLTVQGAKNCVQTTANYGDRLFYSVEDGQSFLTETSECNLTVLKTESNTFERVILINNIYKECVDLERHYSIEINKLGWGDYRIKEQTKDYFILESDREDFVFNYCIKAKRRGYENVSLEEYIKEEADDITTLKGEGGTIIND